jgi:hypothetical protein
MEDITYEKIKFEFWDYSREPVDNMLPDEVIKNEVIGRP